MSSLVIGDVSDDLEAALKARAAENGRSVQDEAKQILRAALSSVSVSSGNLYEAIRRRVEPFGGADLAIPEREPIREPPTFD